MFELILILVIGTSLWVFFDSKSIGVEKGRIQGFWDMGPGAWFWSCLLLWIIGFPAYLAKRHLYKSQNLGKSSTGRANLAEHRPCPFCAEQIKAEAVKCRYCGSAVEPLRQPGSAQKSAQEAVRHEEQERMLSQAAARKRLTVIVLVGIILVVMLAMFQGYLPQLW